MNRTYKISQDLISLKKLRSLPIEKKALILVLVVFAILDAYRVIHLWITGFIVSDEYGYIKSAEAGQLENGVLYDRYFFAGLNVLLFRIFNIDTIDKFIIMLPFYLFLWSFITELSFYKIMKLLGFSPRVIAYSLLSSLFLISFVLLSLGFLTEPVGLALAMSGIYFLMKLAKERKFRWILIYSLASALFFSAAMYSRQPYGAFLIGGLILPPIFVMSVQSNPHMKAKLVKAVLSFFIFLVVAISALSLSGFLQGQITSISTNIGSQIVKPIITTSTTSTVSSVGPSYTSTSSATTQTVVPSVSINPAILNTLFIFFGGIFLGWGPVLYVFGAVGLLSLIYQAYRQRSLALLGVFLLCLYAFGSYFVVSYIFSSDSSYLTLQHYSTIIRFSDTATPAFFLTVPFFFSLISRKKILGRGALASLIVITLLLVPVYQVYAASNLDLPSNPFVLSYRTGGVMIRDYIISHESQGTINIIGFSSDAWWFVPGNSFINNVKLYPYLNYTQFLKERLTNFYVYGSSLQSIYQNLPYLKNSTNSDFTVISSSVIFNSNEGSFMHFTLEWR